MSGWDNEQAVLGFRMGGRQVKFILPMPNPADFTRTLKGKERTNESALKAHEQAIRQKWRAMALVIKAKLEAVESGITEFDDEFMAHIVLPDGSTAGQFMRPQIKLAYEKGDMPALLPDYSKGNV
ncbi:MAG: hypothetical protein JKY34_01260 [Kordiimonadaceae bacterium]|nr:hypothetical protein [Kordiimonadaceae bacterium]